MEKPWYTADELTRWSQAAANGFTPENAQWLAEQLNLAFAKGQQIQSGLVRNSLLSLSLDMHQASTRPCETCRRITEVLGEPFGCELRRTKIDV